VRQKQVIYWPNLVPEEEEEDSQTKRYYSEA